jgi:hypothetical protein
MRSSSLIAIYRLLRPRPGAPLPSTRLKLAQHRHDALALADSCQRARAQARLPADGLASLDSRG